MCCFHYSLSGEDKSLNSIFNGRGNEDENTDIKNGGPSFHAKLRHWRFQTSKEWQLKCILVDRQGENKSQTEPSVPFFITWLWLALVYIQYSMSVCWKRERDIISTFTREQPSIHLKAPGGQSPAQTHAAALLCAHANTRAHTHTQSN